MVLKSSCHCGRVAFEVAGTPTGAMAFCNCSVCFCPSCGIHPYGEGVDPKGKSMAAINIRCLEGIDLGAVPVRMIDGRSM